MSPGADGIREVGSAPLDILQSFEHDITYCINVCTWHGRRKYTCVSGVRTANSTRAVPYPKIAMKTIPIDRE